MAKTPAMEATNSERVYDPELFGIRNAADAGNMGKNSIILKSRSGISKKVLSKKAFRLIFIRCLCGTSCLLIC